MLPDSAAPARSFSPATPARPSASPAFPFGDAAAEARARLAAANHALWTTTLSLMVAFLHVRGPSDRFQLAGRIARNLEILASQESVDPACRAGFARLAARWQARADQCRAPRRLPEWLDSLL